MRVRETHFGRLAALTWWLLLLAGPRAAGAQTAADSAWLNGDMARAERLYAERLASHPTDERALHRLALARAWDERYEESLALLDRLLNLSPANLEARVDRARVLAWQGDLASAIQQVDRVLETSPDFPPALAERARLLAWAGDPGAAVSVQEKLLVRVPGDRAAWRSLARYLAWAARLGEAIAIYDSLVNADPSDRESRLGLAVALSWSDRLDSAALVYEALLAENRVDREALAGLARVAGWSSDLVKAEEFWKRALALDPHDPALLAGLGQTLRWQGRPAAALPVLEQAVELGPRDEAARQELLLARRSLAPRLSPRLLYESDSDANRILTGSVSFATQATRHWGLAAELYGRTTSIADTPLEAAAWGGLVEILASLEPGWNLSGGIGVSGADAPDAKPIFAVRTRFASPSRHRFGGSIAFNRRALDESAPLILNDVRVTLGEVELRAEPRRDWAVRGGGSFGEFDGSEPNQRLEGHASVVRTLTPNWRVGVYLSAFGFEKDLDDGYFDPSFYGIAAVGVEWRKMFGPVRTGVVATPGVQQIGIGGETSVSGRGIGYAAFELAPGRELAVRATYNSTGLNRLGSGDGGYRYFSAAVSGSWVF